MALSAQNIISYQSLKGIGPKAIQILNQYTIDNNITLLSNEDLLQLINYCIIHRILPRIKEPFASYSIDRAVDDTNRMLERSEKLGISTVCINDANFPSSLLSLIDGKGKSISPSVLYIKGNLDVFSMKNSIAIIGTREPTKAGVKAGLFFSEKFARAGFNVISGLALGCDTTAHQGALNASGVTTAFIASGLDMPVYPTENSMLANDIIANGGAIISEYPLGTPIMANRFVERDRLQSGLAQATLAIQTGVKGGTLHAVNSTIDNHKPLYMIQYKGCELEEEKVQGNQHYLNSGKAMPISSENVESVIAYLKKLSSQAITSQPSLFD